MEYVFRVGERVVVRNCQNGVPYGNRKGQLLSVGRGTVNIKDNDCCVVELDHDVEREPDGKTVIVTTLNVLRPDTGLSPALIAVLQTLHDRLSAARGVVDGLLHNRVERLLLAGHLGYISADIKYLVEKDFISKLQLEHYENDGADDIDILTRGL